MRLSGERLTLDFAGLCGTLILEAVRKFPLYFDKIFGKHLECLALLLRTWLPSASVVCC